MCPILGAYVVVRGLGFMGDGLAHGVLPGLVLAVIIGGIVGIGANVSGIQFLGALPAALAMALLSGYLIRRVGLSEDTSVGILFAGMFALGLVMLTAARNLPVKLEDVLLGNVLGVSQGEMLVTLGLAAAVLLVVYFLHKELVFTTFDPIGASVIGVPTEKLEYVLLCLLAVVVVLALPAVGIVLVISMLITPAAAASLLVRNFPAAIAVGAMIGVASAIAGLYISFHFNLPSGPLMALVATGFFVLAVVYRGQIAGRLRSRTA
jgi:manganese/iron transport system permease protein